jgi:hypothetical protein
MQTKKISSFLEYCLPLFYNLDRVGVDLTYLVFSHGQLYTALSRIPDHTCAVIHMRPGETSTVNVTYRELLLQ